MKLFLISIFLLICINIMGDKVEKSSNLPEESTISLKDEIIRFSLMEGYVRTMMFYRNDFDLGSYYIKDSGGANERVLGSSKHKPTLKELYDESSDSTVSYNLRFRLSPSIQVGEYLKAVVSMDVFDNILLGDLRKNSLLTKEAYLSAKSPFGLVKIGRMASQWGLGIYRNDGRSKFANNGSYVDQFYFEKELSLPFLEFFKVGLAYEINDSGIGSKEVYQSKENYDINDDDDSTSYTIYVSDKMKDDLRDEYLDLGKTRIDWGLVYSYNSRDSISKFHSESSARKYSLENLESSSHSFDLYAALYYANKFKIEAELLFNIEDYQILADDNSIKDENSKKLLLLVQNDIYFYFKTLSIGLDFGLAYTSDSREKSNDLYNSVYSGVNNHVFFSSDSNIDLIFFKEIAMNSNLYFIKPHIKWLITSEFSIDLWSVSSLALDSNNTFGFDKYLGTEIDLKAQFLNKDGFNFGVMGGLYIPGKGMDWLGENKTRNSSDSLENTDKLASYAATIQAFFILKF